MKKNNAFIFLFLITTSLLFSQNIGINGTGTNAHPSALLDIDATATPSLGVLIPRIALQALNISSPVSLPATSLLVYNTASAGTGTNTVNPGYYYWDGTQWVRFNTGNLNNWSVLGNAGTSSASNFIGTIDAQDLVFKTNNTEKMRLLNTGYFGINTNSPNSTLHVNGSVSASIVTVTTDYTALNSDFTIVFNTTATKTLTLPSASTCKGRIYNIVSRNGYDIQFSVAIKGAGTSGTTLSQCMSCGLISIGSFVTIQSDGTDWLILGF